MLLEPFFPNYIMVYFVQKVLNSKLISLKKMTESFDREKIVDCMFDHITSSILAELEDGEKQCSFLAQQSSISESEVLERLSYLIEHGFISKNTDNGKCSLFANSDKLGSIIENSDNFDAAIDGLEKMDSYLN